MRLSNMCNSHANAHVLYYGPSIRVGMVKRVIRGFSDITDVEGAVTPILTADGSDATDE